MDRRVPHGLLPHGVPTHQAPVEVPAPRTLGPATIPGQASIIHGLPELVILLPKAVAKSQGIWMTDLRIHRVTLGRWKTTTTRT
jgi:hypothetical protein